MNSAVAVPRSCCVREPAPTEATLSCTAGTHAGRDVYRNSLFQLLNLQPKAQVSMKDSTDGGGKELVSDGQGAMVCDSGFYEGVYAGPVRHGTIVGWSPTISWA